MAALIFGIVFGVFFAICCGIIASNKNRSEGLAVFCGAVFGIFALIVYLLLSKKEKK